MKNSNSRPVTHNAIDPRACSAVGQGGLVSLYEAMFQQYGITCAQVLVTKNDFRDRQTLMHLRATMGELIRFGVIPIVNENDAVSPPAEEGADLEGVISVVDNDSLASNLATQMNASLMLLLSDVEGIYRCATHLTCRTAGVAGPTWHADALSS
jgi:delta-1-pyrroline-5-carboxylate synthetase